MPDIPIEKLLPKANYSIYTLVSMAATRALELSEGRRCLVEKPVSDKFTTMALEEIAAGKIESKEGVDGKGKKEKAQGAVKEISEESVKI